MRLRVVSDEPLRYQSLGQLFGHAVRLDYITMNLVHVPVSAKSVVVELVAATSGLQKRDVRARKTVDTRSFTLTGRLAGTRLGGLHP